MDIYSSNKKARHAKQKHLPQRAKRTQKTSLFGFLKKSDKENNKRRKASAKPTKNKRPLNRKEKTVLITVASVGGVLVVLLIVALIIIVPIISGLDHDKEFGQTEYFQEIVKKDESIHNIALFGLDTRNIGSFKGNTDSMMVLSIDMAEKEIKIISLMRDTLVHIQCGSGQLKMEKNGEMVDVPATDYYGKLNSAYARGGPELAVKVINDNFDLDITEYATVNFYGMSDIIDKIGGIEIDVQEKELYSGRQDFPGLNECIKEQARIEGVTPEYVTKGGLQNLNGMQAVAWARIRSISTAEGVRDDFGRTDRQRVVMEKLLYKALDMNLINAPDTIKAMLKYVKTSLGFDELFQIASKVLTGDVRFEQTRVPQHSYLINMGLRVPNYGSTVYFDLEFASKVINAFIYLDESQEDFLKNNPIEKNDWYDGPVVTPSSNGSSSSDETSSGDGSSDITSSGDSTSNDTPSNDTPSNDTPSNDTPSNDTPSNDTPSNDTPSTDTPGTDTPSTDTPGTDTPGTDTPDNETPSGPVENGGEEEQPAA